MAAAPPPPVELAARWPASRQVVADLGRAGAAAGAVGGFVAGRAVAGLWLLGGVAVGVVLGLVVAPLRLRLHVDEHGIVIDRLVRRERIAWPDVAAVGVDEGAWGRSGRTLGLAVCRRGELLPRSVPALTWTASAFRWRGTRPEERLERWREAALAPVRPWATWAGVPVVDHEVDRWWDRHPDAPTGA